MTDRRKVLISWNGLTKCKSEWAEYFGITVKTFNRRLDRGVSMEAMHQRLVGRGLPGRQKGARDKTPRVRRWARRPLEDVVLDGR